MKQATPMLQSKSDTREYRILNLDNQVQCVVISDPEAKKSSAALSVAVGAFQDPPEVQGIAHYLEHMLFMGTKKYPDENDYSQYLSKHSGESNAYTDQNQTNFYFEVASPAFQGALDRFAQFFISPTMNQSSSARELDAVHSEHSKNIQQDGWRKFQLMKHTSRPGEPFSKFSTGDRSTLSVPNVRESLLDFYQKYYSSNLMKLVVYSNEVVDKTAEMVGNLFSLVSNKQLVSFRLPNAPFDPSILNNLYRIVPIRNKKTIEYIWFIGNQQQHYKNSPGEYISFLIGHEGQNSLLSLLIREGLAFQLSAGSTNEYHSYTEFSVTITLTDRGLQQVTLISEYLMYYILMLKTKGVQQWVFDEIKHIRSSKFDTVGMNHGMNFVSDLAKKMQSVPAHEILVKDYLMEEWRPELILAYLEQMKQENLRVNIMSPLFEGQTDQVEPIYGTKYSVQPLEKILERECQVDLPPPNKFFASSMDLIPESLGEYPTEITSTERLRVFFKADHRFKLPKGQIELRLEFQNTSSTRDDVLRNLYLQLLKNHLREMDYMAETANVLTTISYSAFSLDLQIKGFDTSLTKFVESYLDRILTFEPSNLQEFQDLKNKKKLSYENFFKEIPYKQAYEYHLLAVRDGLDCDPLDKFTAIDQITFEDICEFSLKWKSGLYSEAYIGGNFTSSKALEISSLIETKLASCSSPLPVEQIRPLRGVRLEEGVVWGIQHSLTNPAQTNSAFLRHYQFQQISVRNKIIHDLMNNFLSEPTFNYLRTIEQLGYIVACVPVDSRGMLGISFMVQSNIKPPQEIAEYVDKLVAILAEKVKNLSEADFATYRNSLLISRSQKPKTLSDETRHFWEEIAKHLYVFNRQSQQLQMIPTITLEEFKSNFQNCFLKSPRCFETHLISTPHVQSNSQFLQKRLSGNKIHLAPSISCFKKKAGLFPDYYSH